MPPRKAKQPHPGWGGARKGAGRKPLGEAALVRVTVSLSQRQRETLDTIDGNRAAAVRSLIDAYQA